MERKFYEKYTALKKRKLLDEGLERKREEQFKELYEAMKDWISDLEKDKDDLCEKLADKDEELEKVREDLREYLRAKDSEILRLKKLLDEHIGRNNSTATGSVDQTPEAIHDKPTEMSPRRKTPRSNGNTKRVQLSKNASIPHRSLEEESQELECSRRYKCSSENETDEWPSARMFHLMLQSLVRMKVTVDDGTESFSVSVCHEASGYSFKLAWLENPGEWSYKLSSLGTLERIAVDWMKQDITFSMNMCRVFFERISNIITRG